MKNSFRKLHRQRRKKRKRPGFKENRKSWNHEVSLRPKIKRQHVKRVIKIIKGISVSLSFLVALAFFIHSSLNFLLTSKSFQIKGFRVLGNKVLSEEEILKIAAIPKGKNIFKLNLRQVKENFSFISRVKNVKIKKRYPDCIELSIEERKALGRVVKRGRPLAFDQQGVLFEIRDEASSLPLVLVECTRPVLEKVAEFLITLRKIDPALYSQLKSIDARSLKNLKLKIGNMEVDWGRLPSVKEEVLERTKRNFAYLKLVLEDLRARSLKGGSLSLQFLDGEKGRIIFRRKVSDG